MHARSMKTRQPQVKEAAEFLEITRDFVDSKDVVREAISNALDWGATEVKVTVVEDKTVPTEDLVITFEDNGEVSMNKDLRRSSIWGALHRRS